MEIDKTKNLNLSYLRILFLFLAIQIISSQLWAKGNSLELPPKVQNIVYNAQQAMEKKEYRKAANILREFIAKNPKIKHYFIEFTLGNALYMEEKHKDALTHYRAATGLNPDFAPAWQNLAKICFDTKQYELAGDYMLKAYETEEKKDLTLIYNASVSYIMAKKEKKALTHLEYIVSNNAKDVKAEWLEALLKVYIDLKLEKKALNTIWKLIEKDENNPCWWKTLAKFYLNKSNYKKASMALQIYSYLTPLNKQETILMGDLYSNIGIPLKAAEYYEKVVESEKDPLFYEKLALAYMAGHKPDKALNVLNRALKAGASSKILFMMGQVYYEKEDFAKAYDAFKQSIQKDTKEQGRNYLMMGYCALQMSKKKEAQVAFQNAVKFSKHREQAQQCLKSLAFYDSDDQQ